MKILSIMKQLFKRKKKISGEQLRLFKDGKEISGDLSTQWDKQDGIKGFNYPPDIDTICPNCQGEGISPFTGDDCQTCAGTGVI